MSTVVLLLPGERIVVRSGAAKISPSGRHAGYLTLTDRRLIFEGQVAKSALDSIVGGGSMTTLMDLPLGYVYNVHFDKSILGRQILRVEALGDSHEFRELDANSWKNAIASAKAAAPPAPVPKAAVRASESTRPGGPVIVHVQAPVAPQPQVFLHCTHCGKLNTPGIGRCSSCGATL